MRDTNEEVIFCKCKCKCEDAKRFLTSEIREQCTQEKAIHSRCFDRVFEHFPETMESNVKLKRRLLNGLHIPIHITYIFLCDVKILCECV